MLALAGTALGADTAWLDDLEAAKAQAVKDGKDLLLNFTGSDWCPWCIKLKKEVFGSEAFKKEGPKYFVLVELDFPRQKAQAEKLKQQNEKLRSDFGVETFPTLLLTDAKGLPYARTGYQEGGPEKYLEHLAALRGKKAARDKLLADAGKAGGVERARLLDQAAEALARDEALSGYEAMLQEIVALDSENKAGLKAKYQMRLTLAQAARTAQRGDLDAALAKVDAFIKESVPTGEPKQHTYFLRAMILLNKQDAAAALTALEAARDAVPQSERAKEIGEIIEKVKADQKAKAEEKPKAEEKK